MKIDYKEMEKLQKSILNEFYSNLNKYYENAKQNKGLPKKELDKINDSFFIVMEGIYYYLIDTFEQKENICQVNDLVEKIANGEASKNEFIIHKKKACLGATNDGDFITGYGGELCSICNFINNNEKSIIELTKKYLSKYSNSIQSLYIIANKIIIQLLGEYYDILSFFEETQTNNMSMMAGNIDSKQYDTNIDLYYNIAAITHYYNLSNEKYYSNLLIFLTIVGMLFIKVPYEQILEEFNFSQKIKHPDCYVSYFKVKDMGYISRRNEIHQFIRKYMNGVTKFRTQPNINYKKLKKTIAITRKYLNTYKDNNEIIRTAEKELLVATNNLTRLDKLNDYLSYNETIWMGKNFNYFKLFYNICLLYKFFNSENFVAAISRSEIFTSKEEYEKNFLNEFNINGRAMLNFFIEMSWNINKNIDDFYQAYAISTKENQKNYILVKSMIEMSKYNEEALININLALSNMERNLNFTDSDYIYDEDWAVSPIIEGDYTYYKGKYDTSKIDDIDLDDILEDLSNMLGN